nr:unnamed protein product [Callosobruchus analis]
MDVELSAHDKAILNCVFNPNLPLEEVAELPKEELKDIKRRRKENKRNGVEAVRLAESGNLEKGLAVINEAIEIAPTRPSLYNNRAHIYQFLRKFDAALEDVQKAISLCSDNHTKTACLAHCQRGVLYRKSGRVNEARGDFEFAAKMGNQFAKSQLVELNPYAALCNQMLKQVMDTMK